MMITSPPGSRRQTETRARIIEVAEGLFRSIGYTKTTVADIARELDMSPANVYRFFESKKAINEALAERFLAETEKEAAAIAARPDPAADRLRDFFLLLSASVSTRIEGEPKMHEMVRAAMAESWPVIAQHIQRVFHMIHGIVADGIARGEFPPQNALAATIATHCAFASHLHPQMVNEGQSMGCDIEAEVRLLADFVVTTLKTGFHPSVPLPRAPWTGINPPAT